MEWDKEIIKQGNEIIKSINFKDVTPNKSNVLNFLKMSPCDIKVIIIGQDPYPTKGVANGRAFAVNKDVKIPQSLNNIFKEIKETNGVVHTDRTLESWEKQGVLLLNMSFTTIIGFPNAHKKLWHDYSINLIKWIDNNFDKITWVLWGNNAKQMSKHIINGKTIKDAHPSPLSVRHRNKNTFKIIRNIKW